MSRIVAALWCASIAFYSSLHAIHPFLENTKPWLSRSFELQPTFKAALYSYPSVHTAYGSQPYATTDGTLTGCGSVAIFDRTDVGVNLGMFVPQRGKMCYESCAISCRYLWLDDIAADAISLTTGLSLRNISSKALHSPTLMYHQYNEIEGHIAIGKELCCLQGEWLTRGYATVLVGAAGHSGCWLGALAALEHKWLTGHRLSAAVAFNQGLGAYGLRSIHHFKGYAHIRYRSSDAAIEYGYCFDNFAIASLRYNYQFYSHNCPEKLSALTACFVFPFGF